MERRSFIKRSAALLLLFTFLYCAFVPYFAEAKTGTLGTEKPKITAAFRDADGNTVDGNVLTAGTYDVDIVLSGISTLYGFQMTANYTEDITINSYTTLAASEPLISGDVYKNEDYDFVVILSTDEVDCIPIAKKQVMLTLNITVNTPDNTLADFADCFVLSTDPECTLINVDKGDGIEPCYVFVGNEKTDTAFPEITADMSPDLTVVQDKFDVAGQIAIAIDVTGTDYTGGVGGLTVAVDGTEISAVTDSEGKYVLSEVPVGTHTVTISGETTVDRQVTLIVSAEKAVDDIINVDLVPVVVCDYNHDTSFNSADVSLFYNGYNSKNNIYCDLNTDGSFNSADVSLFYVFNGKKVTYNAVTL